MGGCNIIPVANKAMDNWHGFFIDVYYYLLTNGITAARKRVFVAFSES